MDTESRDQGQRVAVCDDARAERNKSLSGPKPGPVSIIRCEASWGATPAPRHAVGGCGTSLLTFPNSVSAAGWRIVMNHLGRSQSGPASGTEAGVRTLEDAKVFSIAQLTVHTCQLISTVNTNQH